MRRDQHGHRERAIIVTPLGSEIRIFECQKFWMLPEGWVATFESQDKEWTIYVYASGLQIKVREFSK